MFVNDTNGLRYVLQDGSAIGQFYKAPNELHWAKYVPYCSPPRECLCGKRLTSYPPCRQEADGVRFIACVGCEEKLMEVVGE